MSMRTARHRAVFDAHQRARAREQNLLRQHCDPVARRLAAMAIVLAIAVVTLLVIAEHVASSAAKGG
jgi:Ca2+/H+ antiporter